MYSEHSHSRFPIYEDSEDNIVGIISSKDILMSLSKKVVDDNTKLKELIREPYFVPETKRNFEIFNEMRNSGDKIAIIIDEYGGLSGVLTLRKLLEEVVGDFGEEGTEPEEELIEIDIKSKVKKLMEMGFPEDVCTEALERYDGDENLALNYLLGG